MPIYHLDRPEDRLAIALGLPSREDRVLFVERIARRYGDEAADKLKADLREIAKARKA